MAIEYSDIQLRIQARADGQSELDVLDQAIVDIKKDLDATAEASKRAAAAQAQTAASLQQSKKRYDDVRVSLAGAQNELRFLTARSREAGAAQSDFAAQISAAKDRVQRYRDEMLLARDNLRVVGAEHRNTAAEVRSLAAEQRRLAGVMRKASDEAEKQRDALLPIGEGLKRLGGIAAGLQLGREFIDSNLAIESLERTMVQLTGSTEAAAKEIDWLKQTSSRLGVQVNDSARAYASLAAATKGTRLEGEQTHAIFEAVAGAMAKLGRSSADTEGALQAISQMVGKGTVQMEELRGQLAERLPGALQATAEAMGITTQELTDMVGSGQVLASDLIPKLTEGLTKLYGTGKIDGTQASWNRLKNSISETFTMIGQDGGVMSGVVVVLDSVNVAVRLAAAGFEFLGKSMGTTAAAIATFDLRHPIESLRRWNAEILETRNAIREKFKITFDDEFEAKIRKFWGSQTAESDKAKTSAQAVADAATLAGENAAKAAPSLLSVEAAYSKVSKAAAQATSLAVKSAEARQAEAGMSTRLAEAFGTEADKREAAVYAANSNAVALKAVSDARVAEANAARNHVAAMVAAAGGEANLTAEQLKGVQAAKDSADAKQAEAEKAVAATEQARIYAAQLESQSAAVADNSARVDELKAAMDGAMAAYAAAILAYGEGKATQDEVTAAQIAAGQAVTAYRDALSDKTAAVLRDAEASRSSHQISMAQLSADQQIARTQLELARIRGDSRGVQEAQNKLRMIEIKMLQATAEGSRAEARAILASAEAKKAELAATGQLTPARQAEIDRMIASAKLKQIEADKSDQLAKLQKELADEIERVARTGGSAGDGLADSYNRAADASNRLNKSIMDRPNERRPGGGGGGSGGGSGGGGSGGSGGRELTPDQLRAMGKTMREIEDYYINKPEDAKPGLVNRMVSTSSTSNDFIARNLGLRGEQVKKFSDAYGQILDDKMAEFRARFSNTSIWSATDYRNEFANYEKQAQQQAVRVAKRTDKPQETTKLVTVNIKAGGRELPVQVRDDASADNLLKALEAAARVAS